MALCGRHALRKSLPADSALRLTPLFLPKPKSVKSRIDACFVYALANFSKIIVTGIGNRLRRIQWRQIARVGTGGVKLVVRKFFVTDLIPILRR